MPSTNPTYRILSNAKILTALFLLVMFAGEARSQEISSSIQNLESLIRYVHKKYGLNQELYSGKLYYQRYAMYQGDPYFPENRFYDGSISLKGEAYEGVRLKYDIYSQQVVLEYTDFDNRYNQLIIDSTRIDLFRLDGFLFKKMAMPEGVPLFYQLFESGPVTAYVHWSKTATTYSNDLRFTHRFSKTDGTFYFGYNGGIHSVKNRKSVISIFPDALNRPLKKYFRKEKLSFREAEPEDLQHLVRFVADQLNSSARQ